MKLIGTSCLYLCVYLSQLHLSQFLLYYVCPTLSLHKIRRTAKLLHKIRPILVLTADLHKTAGPAWYHGIYHGVYTIVSTRLKLSSKVKFQCKVHKLSSQV
jgi:hypothetical protein